MILTLTDQGCHQLCPAVSNAILLLGRIPGYKKDEIQLLPCSTTKRGVWRLYQDTAAILSLRAVSYVSFSRVSKRFLPHLVVAKLMTDLCAMCQKNSTIIMHSVNLSEEKSVHDNWYECNLQEFYIRLCEWQRHTS